MSRLVTENASSWDLVLSAWDLLGGEGVLGEIESRLDLHQLIARGFPNQILHSLINNVPELSDGRLLGRLYEYKDHLRRGSKSNVKNLSPFVSEKIWHFAIYFVQAREVLGSHGEAMRWLLNPSLALGWECPFDFLSTSPGRDLLTELLQRIDFGVYV